MSIYRKSTVIRPIPNTASFTIKKKAKILGIRNENFSRCWIRNYKCIIILIIGMFRVKARRMNENMQWTVIDMTCLMPR